MLVLRLLGNKLVFDSDFIWAPRELPVSTGELSKKFYLRERHCDLVLKLIFFAFCILHVCNIRFKCIVWYCMVIFLYYFEEKLFSTTVFVVATFWSLQFCDSANFSLITLRWNFKLCCRPRCVCHLVLNLHTQISHKIVNTKIVTVPECVFQS